ncbi:MAG: exodeoxyribonuclease VII large subunit [bacterium]|nr:exodeoxyribonuclease VII large subunit [bacterium]
MIEQNGKVFEVSEITSRVKAVIEGYFDEPVSVRGEISNFTHHSSGHLYFSLKDDAAVLRCVCFKGVASRLRFEPDGGMKVVCGGDLTVYERSGQYQMLVKTMAPLGAGDLALALENLKRKLAEEGLFDEERKRSLPRFPRRIGIITSATGAAFRDIKNVLSRRWPGITIVSRNTRVQGEGAAEDITTAIAEFNDADAADVLIVGRGGGSLEDLWAFNEEITVRAVADSRIPVVSAVGHEIDWALTDFAADLRAPTPSAAAELTVPDKVEISDNIANMLYTARILTETDLSGKRQEVESLVGSYAIRTLPRSIQERYQTVDDLTARGIAALRTSISLRKARLETDEGRLGALDPSATMRRGYTVAVGSDGTLLKSVKDTARGDELRLTLRDGKLKVGVEEIEEGGFFGEEKKG